MTPHAALAPALGPKVMVAAFAPTLAVSTVNEPNAVGAENVSD
jgi:hypothetical protein